MDSSGESFGIQTQNISLEQLNKLKEKVEKSHVPTDLRENLIDRIQQLELLRRSAMGSSYILEYESTAAYIHWTTSLPWESGTKDLLDIHAAKAILDKNHYGLNQVKERILDYLAAIILGIKNNETNKTLRAPILCLVGLAGTGKTTLASSIAESLGRKFERIPFGGMGNAQVLRGQSRTLPDSEPGVVIKRLVHGQSKNPVILLDELDRISEAARADIMGVLIELLDPEQNKAYADHYIDYPFDLSQVLFVATANNTSHIATAVLDRLELIQMPSYTDEEKIVIAKNYLFPKAKAKSGLLENQLLIDETVWPGVIRPLGFDSGIRSLDRTIEAMCRKVARLIVEGQATSTHITNDNIKQFLPTW